MKKNKKKLFSILTIATSLVLCIAATFGVTLAFFGGSAKGDLSAITLKTGIEIGAAIESSVGTAKVVPGQSITITATGTLSVTDKGTPTTANAVDGVVRAKFNVGTELGEVTISGGEGADVWVKSGDYYYLTEDDQTTLREVSPGTSVKIFGNLTVSKNFTNTDSGKSVEASVVFETIQAGVYDSVTGNLVEMTIANATTSTSPLYSAFDAIKYVDEANLPKYNVTIVASWNDWYVDNGTNSVHGYPLKVQFDDGEIMYIDGAKTLTGTASKVRFTTQYLDAEWEVSYDIYTEDRSISLYIDSFEDRSEEETLTQDTTIYIVIDYIGENYQNDIGGSN